MKPKNKFQQRVADAGNKLPKLTEKQIQWGYENCIEHIGQRSAKGKITCTKCGHSWQGDGCLVDTLTGCNCPHCNTHLKVEETRKRNFMDYEYMCLVSACEGFQVLRFIYIECNMKVGQKANYYHSEVVQRWIAPDGKYATMAKLRPMGYYSFRWTYWSFLEIRSDKHFYNIAPIKIYPRQKLTPEVKRSGYNKDFFGLTPFDFFRFLLSENKSETLQKAGQENLFTYFAIHSSKKLDDYWTSVKICIRNNYTIADASIWCDYIDLLRYFGKDLHNPKYVCPTDLKAEHDRYVQKKRNLMEKERREQARQKALENENEFKEMKAPFFGIQFSDGQIQIRVLESVEEIMQEGDLLHHCVFTNEYHLKPDSLILSACLGDKKLETIELSLSKLQVLQCRGLLNKNTEYHEQILKLVNKNIPKIRKRIVA